MLCYWQGDKRVDNTQSRHDNKTIKNKMEGENCGDIVSNQPSTKPNVLLEIRSIHSKMGWR
jgi:hypothetical protein